MKPTNPRILTINGGSSSIKFALFEAGESLPRILEGGIERIGLPDATFRVKGLNQADDCSRLGTAPDPAAAVGARFCHRVGKWIGAFTAALGGLDTLVFARGIGENAPTVRAGFAMGWDCLESNSKKSETRPVRA